MVPDDYLRTNGVARYSQGDAARGFSVTAQAYHGRWNSTDQVAESAVASGQIPYYGSQNPADGGVSGRYSLQGEWHRRDAETSTHVLVYAVRYDLDLFSNFPTFLDSPDGDQFEQQDGRDALGLRAGRSFLGELWGRKMTDTIGAQLQQSWIDTGLRTRRSAGSGRPRPATMEMSCPPRPRSTPSPRAPPASRSTTRSDGRTNSAPTLDCARTSISVAVHDPGPANSGGRGAAWASQGN